MYIKQKRIFHRVLEKVKNPPSALSKVQHGEIRQLIEGAGSHVRILNIGAKNTNVSKTVINLDLVQFPNVDILGNAHDLPFKNSSVDVVIIIAVLEIVKNPGRVVEEIYRVLKDGGIVMATLPFLQPYHPDPTDCQRFTVEGVENLFFRFRKIKIRNTRGLFSMYLRITREFLSILLSFNNATLWKGLNVLLGWLLFPLTYIDYLLPDYQKLHYISSSFLYIGKKG